MKDELNHQRTGEEIVICDSCGKEFNDRDILIESYIFTDIEVSRVVAVHLYINLIGCEPCQ